MLVLLEAEPVAGVDPFGTLRTLLEPALEGGAQLRIGAQAAGEGDIRETAVEPGEQLAQRSQTLQLARSEDAVPGVGAGELDGVDPNDITAITRLKSALS